MEREIDVVREAGVAIHRGEARGVSGGESVEEPCGSRIAQPPDLALGEAEHLEADQPPRARPSDMLELGPHTAGEDESPRVPVIVNRPLHRGQHFGHFLPLVEQDGFGSGLERRIRIGAEGGCLRWAVEANDIGNLAARGAGLPDGPRAGDHHRGEVAEEMRQSRVGQSRSVGVVGRCGHGIRS